MSIRIRERSCILFSLLPANRAGSSAAAAWSLGAGRATATVFLLQCFAVLGHVETFDLALLGDPQRHHELNHLEQDDGGNPGPGRNRRNAVDLVKELPRIALDETGGLADRRYRKHPAQQRTGDAADAVHTEHVERVIVAELLLELGAGPEADRAREQADHNAVPRQHEAGGRGDGAEASDYARDHAKH